MTTDDIKTLITAGDPGTAWAAVENFIAQENEKATSAATAQADSKLANANKAWSDAAVIAEEKSKADLTSQKIASDTAAEATKAIADEAISALKSDNERLKQEFQDQANILSAVTSRQGELAQQAATGIAAVESAVANLKAIANEAGKTLVQKQAETRQREVEVLRAQLAEKESKL